jgi:hypothetical protein
LLNLSLGKHHLICDLKLKRAQVCNFAKNVNAETQIVWIALKEHVLPVPVHEQWKGDFCLHSAVLLVEYVLEHLGAFYLVDKLHVQWCFWCVLTVHLLKLSDPGILLRHGIFT